jgi:hypothetical protein
MFSQPGCIEPNTCGSELGLGGIPTNAMVRDINSE